MTTAPSSSSTRARERRSPTRRAPAFESYFRPRRRLPRHRLGDRDRSELAVPTPTSSAPARPAGPSVQSATVKVADRVHDATKNLPEYWNRTDAWYNFTTNVRGVSHVLATVVEDPFGPQPQGQMLDGIAGGTMGADHPVAWCKDYKGGRSFYTGARQHRRRASTKPPRRRHLEGAIDWTAGEPTRPTATAARPCSRTTSRPRSAPAEPERADRLRPAPRRPDHPDRPPRRRAPARPGDRDDAAIATRRRHPGLHRTTRTASTARRSTTTSPPTTGSTSTTRRRRSRTSSCSDGSIVTQTTPTTAAPNTGASLSVWDSVGRLLPALPLQVRRRRPGRPGAPRPGVRAADPPGLQQPRRLLPRGR